jgi:5-methyltetrahydrofolate corrinoid/iron sulfur protein methyltransferase
MRLAADNLHALNPVVAESLRKLDPKPLRELAKRCELSGVHSIDINPGYLSARHEDRMAFMVEAVQEVTQKQLILDSPNPRLLARGLAVCREKPLLNGLSLEERKIEEILPLAAEHGTELVLLLMDERSMVPPTMEGRLAIAAELRERALGAGMREEDLIFDPVLPNLTWLDGASQVKEVVRTVRMLSGWSLFPEPVRTMVGLSNLRSGQRHLYPVSVETSCLTLLAGAGLSMALVNVLQPELMTAYQVIRQFAS